MVAAAAAALGVLSVGVSAAGAYEYHSTDLLDFNAPQAPCTTPAGVTAPCVGNYYEAYPWAAYELDQHIDGVSVGLSGVNLSGLPPLAFYSIASFLWDVALLELHLAFLVFGFAFSLNLLTGSHAGAGSVGQATGAA